MMCVKQYPTEAEADARKYRDVIAYIESRGRAPSKRTLAQQQQQQRAERKATRASRNMSPEEQVELARQLDQRAAAAVRLAMRKQVKRKVSMRDSTTAQSPAARAQAQREQDQQLKVARTEVEARKEFQNNNKLRRHRAVVEKLKAMAKAEITAIDDRVEVLVAAHDQLLLKLVYDGNPPATAAADGKPPVIPATAGGAPQAASGPPPAVPAVITVDPAVIVVVDGDDDTHAAPATRAAAAATATAAAAAAAAMAAATAAVEKRRADLWAELSFAALTDNQVDKLYAQLEVMMVVCRHFKERGPRSANRPPSAQVDEPITAH